MSKEHTAEEWRTIQYLRKKLDWYVHEASDMEYNEAEVHTMLELVKLMDPPDFAKDEFTSEKAAERFWNTLELRRQIHEEMERMKKQGLKIVEYPRKEDANMENTSMGDTEETVSEKVSQKLFAHKKISGTVIAAALVIVMSLSVTAGVYAERMGYFYKITDNGKVIDVVTTVGQVKMEPIYNKYSGFEEVPIQYTRYIWIPEVPDGMELKYIEIFDDVDVITADTRYQDTDSEEYILFRKKEFSSANTYNSQSIEEYEELERKQVGGTEIRYMIKENDDYSEYAITFYYQNEFYLIISNLDYLLVKNIADNYIENLGLIH